MITLYNDFHDTSTRAKLGYLSPRRARAIHSRLCGDDSCLCGNLIGMRGPQEVKLELYREGYYLERI